MELLRIKVYLTGNETVQGGTQRAVMLPFTGRCDSPLFAGEILPGGVDTQRISDEEVCSLSARYMLEGTDCAGEKCRLFIENVAVSRPGQEMVTYPSVRTDSTALRWLETADLTGAIEHCGDHIEIVISGMKDECVERIALKRDGLTLRGVLEKPAAGRWPLVLMMHGFGGRMDAFPGGWMQQISDRLTAAGMMTLRFDFNGHGQSDGDFIDMTPMNEVADAAVFLRYALGRADVSEVYLLGHSQGGVVAGMLAGYYHDRVTKLVMLTPAASLKTDAQNGTLMGVTYDPQHIPAYVELPSGMRVGGVYFRMAQTLPIHEVTAGFTGPALAVIGGRDCAVLPEDIRRYGEVMADCTIREYAAIDHGLAGEEREEMLQDIIAFLNGAECSDCLP